jgi:hypothetical protein
LADFGQRNQVDKKSQNKISRQSNTQCFAFYFCTFNRAGWIEKNELYFAQQVVYRSNFTTKPLFLTKHGKTMQE